MATVKEGFEEGFARRLVDVILVHAVAVLLVGGPQAEDRRGQDRRTGHEEYTKQKEQDNTETQ
jgi:hypothetical protein